MQPVPRALAQKEPEHHCKQGQTLSVSPWPSPAWQDRELQTHPCPCHTSHALPMSCNTDPSHHPGPGSS